jgi:hypothetical protein
LRDGADPEDRRLRRRRLPDYKKLDAAAITGRGVRYASLGHEVTA